MNASDPEPLPPAVRCIGLEMTGTDTTRLQHPLAHFVIEDMPCQVAARWPALERPVITLNV